MGYFVGILVFENVYHAMAIDDSFRCPEKPKDCPHGSINGIVLVNMFCGVQM